MLRYTFLLLLLIVSASPAQDDTVRIMPIGDSITELDWQGGYRGYLYKMLADSGVGFDYVGTKTTNHDDNSLGFVFPEAYWDHEGYNSATITGQSGSTWIWNENIEDRLAANPPDVMLLLLGTNDLNSSCCTVADIVDDMSAFLDQIWAFDSTIVVILGSPPPADSVDRSRLNDRVTEYDSLLPALVSGKEALGRTIGFADHHAVMNSTSDLVGDGIHPSPQGYRKMTRVWYDALTALMSLPTAAEEGPNTLPSAFGMLQNYPNPFNPVTTVTYAVPAQSWVTLRVYNVLGEEVAALVDGVQSPGVKRVEWDGGGRPGGVYFCRLTAGSFVASAKMVLTR